MSRFEQERKEAWERRIRELEEIKQRKEQEKAEEEEKKPEETKQEARLRNRDRYFATVNGAGTGYKRPDPRSRYPNIGRKKG